MWVACGGIVVSGCWDGFGFRIWIWTWTGFYFGRRLLSVSFSFDFFLGWWNHLLVLASAPCQWDQLVWCMDMHRCLLLISFQFSSFFPSAVHVLRVFAQGRICLLGCLRFLSSRSNLFCMRPVQSFVGLLVLRARMPFRAIAFFFRCVFLRWYARFAI